MKPRPPTILELKPNIYVVISPGDRIIDGWGANQGFVITEEGVLVIDSGFTEFHANHLMGAIRKRSSKRIVAVINTHDHSDHVFGNEVFANSGALVISHVRCRERVVSQGLKRMRRYRRNRLLEPLLGELEVYPPTVVYSDALTLHLGGKTVRLVHPRNGAHTKGDTMVLLPKDKVLFAGDVLWNRFHPNLEDASFKGWLDALREIAGGNWDFVVAGHGPLAGITEVEAFSRYLETFLHNFRKLFNKELSREEMRRRLMAPGAQSWKLESIIEHNIESLSARLKRGRLS